MAATERVAGKNKIVPCSLDSTHFLSMEVRDSNL